MFTVRNQARFRLKIKRWRLNSSQYPTISAKYADLLAEIFVIPVRI